MNWEKGGVKTDLGLNDEKGALLEDIPVLLSNCRFDISMASFSLLEICSVFDERDT